MDDKILLERLRFYARGEGTLGAVAVTALYKIEAQTKDLAWWKADSAAGWDKCAERRIAQEKAEARVAWLETAYAAARAKMSRQKRQIKELTVSNNRWKAEAKQLGGGMGRRPSCNGEQP